MKFNVGPWPYQLRIPTDLIINEAGTELMGRSLYQSREILISPRVPPDHRFEVLLHELRHCWGFHFPRPRTEEEEADFTASIMGQVMQDLSRQGGPAAVARLGLTDEPCNVRLHESPASEDGLSQIPFHVGPFVYRLILSAESMYAPDGCEMDGFCLESRRLMVVSSIAPPDQREAIAFHEFVHAWEFHTPMPRTAEERCQFYALIQQQFHNDLEIAGGKQALREMTATRIGKLGNPATDWMSPQRVAQSLSISVATVHRMIRAGKFRAVSIGTGQGRRLRVSCEDLDRYLASSTVGRFKGERLMGRALLPAGDCLQGTI